MKQKSAPPHPGIGRLFREAREQLGWTQEDFAEKAIAAEGTIKSAEAGQNVSCRTHKKLVDALNKHRLLFNPPKPPVDIPFPSESSTGTNLATGSVASSDTIRPGSALLDNPHLLAMQEALRHTAPHGLKAKLRLGSIRSPAELKNLWAIDNTAYGEANITFDHFLALWRAFPLGLRVLFYENEIMGAMGIWPVSCQWADQLKSAQLKETQLDSRMVQQCAQKPSDCWYVTGIVVRQKLIGSSGIKQLLEEGLGSWLAQASILYPCEITALAYSVHGRRLLERFNFFIIQEETDMPDRCALYGLSIDSRAALVRLMRARKLDVA